MHCDIISDCNNLPLIFHSIFHSPPSPSIQINDVGKARAAAGGQPFRINKPIQMFPEDPNDFALCKEIMIWMTS
jgi:hypothetical protein